MTIFTFPTSNQPVLNTTLKDLLISFRGTLHADILHLTQQFKEEVQAIGSRVDHIENKTDVFAHIINLKLNQIKFLV